MKASEMFEGIDSSLRNAFDEAVGFELPPVTPRKMTVHRVSIQDEGCVSCSA